MPISSITKVKNVDRRNSDMDDGEILNHSFDDGDNITKDDDDMFGDAKHNTKHTGAFEERSIFSPHKLNTNNLSNKLGKSNA